MLLNEEPYVIELQLSPIGFYTSKSLAGFGSIFYKIEALGYASGHQNVLTA